MSNESFLPVRHPATLKKTLLDEVNASLTYYGIAAPGSLTSEPRWAIQRIVTGPGNSLEITWAGGHTQFNHVWDDRASLSYS